jgi:hypothetical protein
VTGAIIALAIIRLTILLLLGTAAVWTLPVALRSPNPKLGLTMTLLTIAELDLFVADLAWILGSF